MKYFVLFGDYPVSELEMATYDSEQEALERIESLRKDHPYYLIHVIKGEKMEIVASYALKQCGGEK